MPLLFPGVLAADWYPALNWITDGLLVGSFLIIVIPFSDRRLKYLLAFILLSCMLLQISTFQLASAGDNPVLPAAWSIRLRVGYAVFLLGLFLLTVIVSYRRDSRTRQNIETSSLSISEERVSMGKPFTMRYTLACKETTLIKSICIIFSYQQYSNFPLSQGGYPGYEEQTLPVFEKRDVVVYPGSPLVEELDWTIPAKLVPEDGSRKDWCLKVRVAPRKGVILETSYPLKVKWDWS